MKTLMSYTKPHGNMETNVGKAFPCLRPAMPFSATPSAGSPRNAPVKGAARIFMRAALSELVKWRSINAKHPAPTADYG